MSKGLVHCSRPLVIAVRLALVPGLASLAACSGDGVTTGDAGGQDGLVTDGSLSSDTVADQGPAPDVNTATRLTASHPGWSKPLCFAAGCHDGTAASYPHTTESYGPPDCVACHGYNGAPHKSHATVSNSGCASCHGSTDHLAGFKIPEDCVTCHYHP